MKPIFLDIETRSACDLKIAGSIQYAKHETTRLLTVAWKDEDAYHVWLPGLSERPPESYLSLHLRDVEVHTGPLVPVPLCRAAHRGWVGHNCWTFDRIVWNECTEDAWPVQWIDTYPLALACGMPGSLDACGKLLWGEGKYDVGKDALKKASRVKLTEKEEARFRTAKERSDYLLAYCEPENVPLGQLLLIAKYNVQDVKLTADLYDVVTREARLPPSEIRVKAAHDVINNRGVRLDIPFTRALKTLSRQSGDRAIDQIRELTDGALKDQADVQSRVKVIKYLADNGVRLQRDGKDCLAKDLVARYIDTHKSREEEESGEPDGDTGEADSGTEAHANLSRIVKVLELRMSALRVTGGKLDTALQAVDGDGRIRHWAAYWGAHCVSGDTEVLTPTGWQRIEEWGGGYIAQWSPDGSVKWGEASANKFDNRGPMVQFDAPYVSGMVTAGHKVGTFGKTGKFIERPAGEIVHLSNAIVPTGGILSGDGAITANQMKVLVAVQADGHWVTDTRHGRGLQFTFRKTRKIDRIRELLEAVGVPFRIQEFPSCPDQFRVSVRWADCPPWLCPERKLFGPWLLDSTEEARFAFVAELAHWDGHDNGPNANREYYSSEAVNHEWVVTLAHLTGHGAKTTRSGLKTVLHDRSTAYVKRGQARFAPYESTVYCPTTETGYWLYRHNGVVGVTGNTGRWSGRRLQPHNFPRPKEGVDTWALIDLFEKTGGLDYDSVLSSLPVDARGVDGKLLYPYLSVDDAASALLRSILVGDPILAAADLANIEARVLPWCAGEQWLMDAFWKGVDPYIPMAERIVGSKETWPQYPDPKTGKPLPVKKHPYRQILGKVPYLAAGYQGGADAIARYAANMGHSLSDYGTTGRAMMVAYRTLHPRIAGEYIGDGDDGYPIFTGGLWTQIERAAILTVDTGQRTYAGRCEFIMSSGNLICILPSGRRLVYRKPALYEAETKWGKKKILSYWSPRFGRVDTYGGKLTENIVQAISRDVLAHGMVMLEDAGMPVVLHVHDEAVSATDRLPEFMTCMTTCPEWLTDFPLAAEGSLMPRYSKSPPPGTKDITYMNGRAA